MDLSQSVKIDGDVITIYGIKYSGQFFREFASELNKGDTFRFSKRDDGVIVIEKTGG